MRGLSLSGGGVKAAAHIGALKALEENDIRFDCVSGASSGSIIATMYALGYSSDEMWELFKKLAPKIKYYQWKNIFKLIFGVLFFKDIIIDGLNCGDIIEKIFNEICLNNNIDNINQIEMPLFISMVDLQKGTVYIASSKQIRTRFFDNTQYITNVPIATAIRASCSFPVVFSPCEYEGIQFIDGGTCENLPWKALKNIGTDEVWGISFNTIFKERECCSNIVDVATRAMELQGRELATYENEGIDNLITINLKKVSLLDASKIDELYEMGYEQTKQQLKNIEKKLKM